MATVPTITVEELRQKLGTLPPPLLLDVREADEWQYCRIGGATHIPLGELERRADELDPSGVIVVYCHHGVRSRHAGELLLKRGFPRVVSLTGGIDAWSERVDPAVPRY